MLSTDTVTTGLCHRREKVKGMETMGLSWSFENILNTTRPKRTQARHESTTEHEPFQQKKKGHMVVTQ